MYERPHISFIVRLWREDPQGNAWRGYVQDIEGQAHTYFESWTDLVDFLEEYMQIHILPKEALSSDDAESLQGGGK